MHDDVRVEDRHEALEVAVARRGQECIHDSPLAIEVEGRRWIWAPWGEVNWVRNLRAAGRATLTRRGRSEQVTAAELDGEERVRFFRDVFGPFVRSIPGGMTFVRLLDQTDLRHPAEVAKDRRVFELYPLDRKE